MRINVTQYLDDTILKHGNSIAIEDINGELSFNQLQKSAYKVASTLIELHHKNSLLVNIFYSSLS